MQYMFTDSTFETDVTYWRYVLWHRAVKIMNEVGIEGMGCVVDKHAAPQRHLCMESYSIEAMIHYNGPAAHESESFLT